MVYESSIVGFSSDIAVYYVLWHYVVELILCFSVRIYTDTVRAVLFSMIAAKIYAETILFLSNFFFFPIHLILPVNSVRQTCHGKAQLNHKIEKVSVVIIEIRLWSEFRANHCQSYIIIPCFYKLRNLHCFISSFSIFYN